MAAEDIRQLQGRSHGGRSAGRHNLQPQPVERAWRLADGLGGNLGVASRARQAGVAEQDLNDAHVGPVLQKMGRKTVPQRMDRYLLAQPGRRARGTAGGVQYGYLSRSSSRPGNSQCFGRVRRQ